MLAFEGAYDVGLGVKLQLRPRDEDGRARLAREEKLVAVDLLVPFQPGRHRELRRTLVALVHPLLVRVQVVAQPRHLAESGRTLLAAKRFLASVGSHVRFEKTRVAETKLADTALQRFVL